MAELLVVDDDPISRKAIGATLTRAGHTVAYASDGDEGLSAAKTKPPALIITDVIMPRMDGWRFVQSLRADASTALLPVIFLTVLSSDQHRLRGFGLGADDYIAKPVNGEELCFRVARSLDRVDGMTRAARRGLGAQAAFVGDVGQFGPAALFSLLAGERKSGMITFERAGSTARVAFRNGLAVAAAVQGEQDLVGVEAVYDLLGWWRGEFQFQVGEPPEAPQAERVQSPLTFLLMEAARRFDEQSSTGTPGGGAKR
jgi:CheY-like chemotaxis protein